MTQLTDLRLLTPRRDTLPPEHWLTLRPGGFFDLPSTRLTSSELEYATNTPLTAHDHPYLHTPTLPMYQTSPFLHSP